LIDQRGEPRGDFFRTALKDRPSCNIGIFVDVPYASAGNERKGHDQLPLSVVFLFDLAETVRPTLKPLAQGAYEMLGHLKPQDEVSIMVFSSHTELLQGFTTDRALASAAIARASEMKSTEGTFIHEDG